MSDCYCVYRCFLDTCLTFGILDNGKHNKVNQKDRFNIIIMSDNPQIVLDHELFSSFPNGALMFKGSGTYRFLHNEEVKWIALKGDAEDWAIYYHFAHVSDEFVLKSGEKVTLEPNIRTLVPCDDETFKKYRF